MKTFQVQIGSDAGYPLDLKVEAVKFPIAARRACVEYRKKHKGKKIKSLWIKIQDLNNY